MEAASTMTVGAWSMVATLWQQYECYDLYLVKGWDNNNILLYKHI